MFTKKELSLISDSYFSILCTSETFIELKSNNTGHCWIIQKHFHQGKFPIWLHHKHKQNDPYYHKHWQTFTVALAVQSIKSHDDYELKKQSSCLQTAL